MNYPNLLQSLTSDPRYLANLDWGEPRPGHPEATLRAHIAEIESNLEALRPRLTVDDYGKLKLLIHTHDTFKPQARPGVAITDPQSHASLARAFLAEYCDDTDLLAMVQYHDEPFALYRQFKTKGKCNPERLNALLAAVLDWNLFLAFLIIDGCTAGKERESLQWFFGEIESRVQSQISAADIIP